MRADDQPRIVERYLKSPADVQHPVTQALVIGSDLISDVVRSAREGKARMQRRATPGVAAVAMHHVSHALTRSLTPVHQFIESHEREESDNAAVLGIRRDMCPLASLAREGST